MRAGTLARRIEGVRQGLEKLWQTARFSASGRIWVRNGIGEYCATLEELQTATESLRRKNQELATANARAESERDRYFKLFEFAPDGCVLTDAFGKILEANHAIADLLCCEARELLKKPLALFVVKESRKEFYRALLGSTRRIQSWEIRMQPSKSEPFDAEVTADVLRGAGGGFGGFLWLIRDITERKRAEKEIRQSEERYRILFESNPLPMWVFDTETLKFLAVNEAAVRHYGYSREEFLAMTLKSTHLFWDGPFLFPYQPALIPGLNKPSLARHRKKDGTLIDVEVIFERMPWVSKEASLILANDITERKRAESLLAGEKRVLEMIASGARLPDVLDCLCRIIEGATTRHGAVPSLSSRWLRVIDDLQIGPRLGLCGTASYPGKRVMVSDIDPCWADYRDAVRRGLRACWSTPILSAEGDLLGTFAMHYPESASPSLEDLRLIERASHMAGIAIERKRAEEALRRSEERFSKVLRSCSAAIGVGTIEGRLIDVNDRYLEFFGYQRDEMIGRSVGELRLWASLEERKQVIEMLRREGSVRNFEGSFRRKSGEVRNALLSLEVLQLAGEPLVIAMLTDITERKRAEDALRLLSGRLLRLQDEERRRIARELHDSTAQSLATLVMNLSRLEKSLGALDPQVRNVASDSLALAEQSLREIRTLSYLLHPPLLDELGLASAVRWYMDGFSQRSQVRVYLDLPPELERLPREVETALFRVVQESLTNINRHSGSPVARVRLLQGPAELTLEVSDEGRGIPLSALPDLSGTVAGLGVGVMGMSERVAQLGGRLEINSTERGTTVRAILPLARKGA